MFFEFFDWKIKAGIIITVALMLGSVISFIVAWTAPVPTDALSAVNKLPTRMGSEISLEIVMR